MDQMSGNELMEYEDPLQGAEEFILDVLEKSGYEPKGDTSVYRKSGSPAGFVFVPVGWDEARSVWGQCFIEKPLATGNSIYVAASLDSADLLWQIRCLEAIKTKNQMIPGIALDKKYLRVRIDDGDYLQLPVTLTDDVYLGIGLVDQNKNILPSRYFRDSETLESLLEHPKLGAAIDTINSAQETYKELLSVMRGIAEKRNDTFYDGRQDIYMQGVITTPLRDGRCIVARLSTVTCSEKTRNTMELDGNVYLSVGVRTPYYGSFGMTPIEEIPVYMEKTTKKTLSQDVSRLIDSLRADYERSIAMSGTITPFALFPGGVSHREIASYIQ